jgi:hypothetical protein
MKKKVFLTAAIFALMAAGLYAQSESDFEITIYTNKSGQRASITGYNGSEMDVKIPSKINNISVTSIGPSAFTQKNITSVTILRNIHTIGRGAFLRCTSLASIDIPNDVVISNLAFSECTKLTGIIIKKDVGMHNDAFGKCTNLLSVTFTHPIPIENFSHYAFRFLGDIRDKFYETDNENGTPGTYTRPNSESLTWTLQKKP